ncbi:MAG TPA: hypothetical protein DD491_15940 [Halieaceae bacterium]|nr:hypothetical protein [Halieaceae bacterium]
MSSGFRFFPRQSGPMTGEEFEQWHTPEETGRRIVERLERLLPQLVEELPPAAREHIERHAQPQWLPLYTVRADRREDLQHPHLALDECKRFALSIPESKPGRVEFTDRQAIVWQALSSVRQALLAAPASTPGESLQLLEHATWMGHCIAELHVQQYEPTVEGRLRSEPHLNSEEVRRRRRISSEEQHNRWYQLALHIWKEPEFAHLEEKWEQTARVILKREGLKEKQQRTVSRKISEIHRERHAKK